MSKLLSIIIPFYNSEGKSKELLETLKNIDATDIEYIFIDDGSTDNTLQMLEKFKDESHIPTTVISQENKGPGGARNTGLKNASGEYVWFVDSDDNINPEAIDFLRKIKKEDYDFIEFDVYTETGNVTPTPVEAGEYKNTKLVRKILREHISILTNKCVKRNILIQNNLYYPEYCLYEDNPMILLYPYYFKSFYRSNIIGYYQYKYEDSVSKSAINDRYLDRMWTMEWGFRKAFPLAEDDNEKNIIIKKFTRVYLINTMGLFLGRIPNKNWLMAMRITNNYKKIRKEFKLQNDPLSYWEFSILHKFRFFVIWFLSDFLPDQTVFFEMIHKKAWKK